jgi:hypothetical protein
MPAPASSTRTSTPRTIPSPPATPPWCTWYARNPRRCGRCCTRRNYTIAGRCIRPHAPDRRSTTPVRTRSHPSAARWPRCEPHDTGGRACCAHTPPRNPPPCGPTRRSRPRSAVSRPSSGTNPDRALSSALFCKHATTSTACIRRRSRSRTPATDVARQDRLGLGSKELRPGRAGPSWRGVDPGGMKDFPYCGGADLVAKSGEFAVHAPIAPGRIFGGQAQDQSADAGGDGGSAGAGVRGGPAAADELAVPAQDR